MDLESIKAKIVGLSRNKRGLLCLKTTRKNLFEILVLLHEVYHEVSIKVINETNGNIKHIILPKTGLLKKFILHSASASFIEADGKQFGGGGGKGQGKGEYDNQEGSEKEDGNENGGEEASINPFVSCDVILYIILLLILASMILSLAYAKHLIDAWFSCSSFQDHLLSTVTWVVSGGKTDMCKQRTDTTQVIATTTGSFVIFPLLNPLSNARKMLKTKIQQIFPAYNKCWPRSHTKTDDMSTLKRESEDVQYKPQKSRKEKEDETIDEIIPKTVKNGRTRRTKI